MAEFKARARALDMLGRQQIAGIPTAISELFKNAHDAYAKNVIVDYFRSDKLFILRDDGYGMTQEDFEDKWLTLGTESKLIKFSDSSLPDIPTGEERAIMGEKGIGRLAIASIGDHVLVLTRAKRKDGLHDLVMSFVYWKMFEIPGINLNQVHIPIKRIRGGTLPNASDFDELNNEIIDNIVALSNAGFLNNQQSIELLEPLEKLTIIAEKIDKYLLGPSLTDQGHGTHFIICPVNEMLEISIDGDDKKEGKATPLLKALLGFSNTMFPDSKEPSIKTSFRDHKTDEYFDDIISENQFWTPDEYKLADHHILGKFDEYGQFNGTIKVYGKEFKDHVVNWLGNKGLKTKCGPFSVNFAYFQGEQKASTLSDDNWLTLLPKLEKISGIYLYKDNIRILPYGDNENDFLDIELRRNKSAGYYFFSYRRMFGAIEISNANNPQLIEKAGREGLRENIAYGQLKTLMKNLFIQLAADFFRETGRWGTQAGPNAEFWTRQKEEINRQFRAKQEFEKRARTKKDKFQKELNIVFNNIKEQKYSDELFNLFNSLENKLEYTCAINDKDVAVSDFLDIERDTRRTLNQLIESYKIKQPRGVPLSKIIRQDYEVYCKEYERINESEFNPAIKRIDEIFDQAQKKMEVEVSRRKRLENAIATTIDEYQKSTKSEVKGVQEIAKKVNTEVLALSKNIVIDFENKVRKIQTELAHIEPYQLDDEKLVNERMRMENELMNEADEVKETLSNIRNQLENLILSKDISNIDVNEAFAEEIESLREKVDSDLELSQLGLAVSAIQHEFQHTTDTIRKQIRKLKVWADLNEGVNEIYKSFSTNFEHLDNYLTLFKPLNRRLNKKEVNIYGNDIFEFLKSVFYARISEVRHNITLECTSSFSKNIIIGYPSTFYPVFTNIVDNAIFWLKDQNKARMIVLDADQSGLYISNNGPTIDIRDQERIFELGFTRKPLGRGMGLYISKQVLNKNGYTMSVDIPRLGDGVTFKIFKLLANK
jgi:signal transduction histidine kinase